MLNFLLLFCCLRTIKTMVSFATTFGYVVYFVSVNTCGLIMFNMRLLMWVYSSVLGPSVEVNYHRFQFYPSPPHCLCSPSSLFCLFLCLFKGLCSPCKRSKKKKKKTAFVGRANYTTCHVGRVAGSRAHGRFSGFNYISLASR